MPLVARSFHALLRTSQHRVLNPLSTHIVRNWTTLTQTKDALTIHALNDTPFPYIWLRDACQSAQCIHEINKQKLFRTSDIPVDIAPVGGGVEVTANGINITWTDGHQSSFDHSFLKRHASPKALSEWHYDDHFAEQSWNNKTISEALNLFTSYDRVKTDSGLVDVIAQLSRYGMAFVTGVDNTETSDEACEVRKLAERFGEMRQTFYGLMWDVVNIKNSKNIAFTDLYLGLHMDLMYFQHPPRYQVLHCIRNQVVGGTSIIVDGLHAARVLRETHPADFDVLTKTPVSFHYVNDGHHLHREHFTIELRPSTNPSEPPSISHINYSPPFQAPLPLSTPKEFYPALARFAKLLDDPKNTFQYTLREGDAVLFDNRRVLHARTAFADKEGVQAIKDGEPNRWLKGCYIEPDRLADRLRVLKAKLETSSGRA